MTGSNSLEPGMAERFATVHMVVVGSMMIDQITYCERFPADGETLIASGYAQGFGGKGANQAVMAARLGASVSMIGCLGDDEAARAVLGNFRVAGVDVAAIAQIPGTASGVAPIWVDGEGTNRILIAAGANHELSGEHVSAALVARTGTTDVVLAQLETPQAATAAAFRWARGAGARTVLNPAPAASVEPDVLSELDWLVANESEFAAMTGAAPDADAIVAAAERFACGVVVTLGPAGAVFAALGQACAPVPTLAVTAVDTTGAGDAFVGAFGVGLAAGLSPADAVRLGCASGALSVQQRGTQTSYPTRDDVLASISPNLRSDSRPRSHP